MSLSSQHLTIKEEKTTAASRQPVWVSLDAPLVGKISSKLADDFLTELESDQLHQITSSLVCRANYSRFGDSQTPFFDISQNKKVSISGFALDDLSRATRVDDNKFVEVIGCACFILTYDEKTQSMVESSFRFLDHLDKPRREDRYVTEDISPPKVFPDQQHIAIHHFHKRIAIINIKTQAAFSVPLPEKYLVESFTVNKQNQLLIFLRERATNKLADKYLFVELDLEGQCMTQVRGIPFANTKDCDNIIGIKQVSQDLYILGVSYKSPSEVEPKRKLFYFTASDKSAQTPTYFATVNDFDHHLHIFDEGIVAYIDDTDGCLHVKDIPNNQSYQYHGINKKNKRKFQYSDNIVGFGFSHFLAVPQAKAKFISEEMLSSFLSRDPSRIVISYCTGAIDISAIARPLSDRISELTFLGEEASKASLTHFSGLSIAMTSSLEELNDEMDQILKLIDLSLPLMSKKYILAYCKDIILELRSDDPSLAVCSVLNKIIRESVKKDSHLAEQYCNIERIANLLDALVIRRNALSKTKKSLPSVVDKPFSPHAEALASQFNQVIAAKNTGDASPICEAIITWLKQANEFANSIYKETYPDMFTRQHNGKQLVDFITTLTQSTLTLEKLRTQLVLGKEQVMLDGIEKELSTLPSAGCPELIRQQITQYLSHKPAKQLAQRI